MRLDERFKTRISMKMAFGFAIGNEAGVNSPRRHGMIHSDDIGLRASIRPEFIRPGDVA